MIEEIIDVSRYYVENFVDFLLNNQTNFSKQLEEMFSFFILDFISTISLNLKNGETDAKKYLQLMMQKYFTSMESSRLNLPPQFGSTIIVGFMMDKYQTFKTKYPSRTPQSKKKTISKVDESLDSLLDDSFGDLESMLTSSTTTPKEQVKKEVQPEKKEEKWMNGLSPQDIAEIEATIKKDELEIDLDDEFSESYKKGGDPNAANKKVRLFGLKR
jgi:hypothetical protein